jgi:agmatinase
MKSMKIIIQTIFIFVSFLISNVTFAIDKKPDPWTPWNDPKNPNVMIMEKNTFNLWSLRRDTSKEPKREPGLINLQRYEMGLQYQGFPTFFGLPVALTPEDLKAGKVDVAIVGMVADENLIRGAGFAANKLRTLTDYMYFPAGGTDQYVRVDPFKVLRMADYGNVNANFASGQKSTEEIRKVVGEILTTNALPVCVVVHTFNCMAC